MYTPTPFGVMLKQVREDAGFSQGELAFELGKTAQYISNIEKGKNNSPPDDADLQTLIRKLSNGLIIIGQLRKLIRIHTV